MPPRLGVLIIHGMGDQTRRFADAISADLEHRLADKGVPAETVFFCPLFWADVLETRETDLFELERRSADLAWIELRGFVVHNLADALAYRRAGHEAGAVYDAVHETIRMKLRAAAQEFGDDTPVVLLAHSLGGAIMSDYIWERQKGRLEGEGAMERLANLLGIVTFGSNIPLFTLALPAVQPILLPSDELAPGLDSVRPVIEWHNYLDKDDVLGWPLAQVYGPRKDGKPGPKIVDHLINVGGLTTSWNPLCHAEYWTDRNFTGPVTDQIERVLRALPGAPIG